MYQFIQLSDLHVGKHADYAGNLRTIVGDIMTKYPKEVCPVILITGDFVHHGTDPQNEEQYKEVVKILRPLVDKEQGGYTVLTCPGNHDFGQGGENGNMQNYQLHIRQRYLEYIHHDLLGKPDTTWTNETTFFPVSTPDHDARVLFVGLDSQHGNLRLGEGSYGGMGLIGTQQLNDLERELGNPAYVDYTKIVYLHHHLYSIRPFMLLKDMGALKRILKKYNVSLACFGHIHIYKTWEKNDRLAVSAEDCTHIKEKGGRRFLTYHLYKVEDGKVKIKNVECDLPLPPGH